MFEKKKKSDSYFDLLENEFFKLSEYPQGTDKSYFRDNFYYGEERYKKEDNFYLESNYYKDNKF